MQFMTQWDHMRGMIRFIFDEPMVSGKTNANVFTIILLDGRRFFVRNKIPEGTFIIQQPKLDLFAIQ